MAADLDVDPDQFATLLKDSFRQRWTGALGSLEQTLAALAARSGGTPDSGAVRRAAQRRLDFTRHQITPAPETLRLLDRLRADGWQLGLISNCSAEVPTLWQENPMAERITAPVFSCQAQLCKPDPDIYRLAAHALNTRPQRCVFVADGAGGELLGAQAAQMTAIRVRADHVDHSTYGGVGDWNGATIDTLHHLPEALALTAIP
jgi:putative hydrolase of the HAD superfamily